MILSKKRRVDKDGEYLGHDSYRWWCPGCDMAHQYIVGAGEGPRWTFNGKMDVSVVDGKREGPTFTPSLLNSRPGHRCHLFMADGRIQFLGDCEHSLAGQTVDMVPVPEWLQ